VRFLVDEDVAVEVVRCLRQAGHEVSLVTEVLGVRTDDVDIWHHAVRAETIVVTCNRQDFLELAGTAPETGVIILNRRRTRQAECRHLLNFMCE
jgi:predicted nuclease of predicted toxin-antitoxin system